MEKVRKYRDTEGCKYKEDKLVFDGVIERMNHITESTLMLIPNVVTTVVKDPAQTNPEQIIRVTKERSSEVTDAPNKAADKSLEEVFKEMINIQATNCVGSNMDPIQQSFEDLIRSFHLFSEKFGLKPFVTDFL